MRVLSHLFENNRNWASAMQARNPRFFQELSPEQAPDYLWIGCSDSRVPANEIVGLLPGELFVHRNVSNLAPPSDLNYLSVLQFAVDILRVKHIIVCGHHGCGGVMAALRGDRLGIIDNWLHYIQNVHLKHASALNSISELSLRCDKLSELNVIEQVVSICDTTILRNAWQRGQDTAVHGWVYGLSDGLLRDLHICITNSEEIVPAYHAAVTYVTSKTGLTCPT